MTIPNINNPTPPLPSIAILGGRVIDPASKTDTTADVFIEHGRIAAITPRSTNTQPTTNADITIDARARSSARVH